MKPKPFYMVYGVGQRAPTVEHRTLSDARREAARLADHNPGVEFVVLAAVEKHRRVQPVERVEFNLDDWLPF